MANRSDPFAKTVHGTNAQNLVEPIVRKRIHECLYWKQECFGLSAEDIVDKAMDLKYIGGTYAGNNKPTPFICLVLKLLQIQPSKEIILEFIKTEEFKYVRALGAFYMRLVGRPMDVYQYLEPLLNDYRKVRMRNAGGWQVTHMDEFIDEMLTEKIALGIALPPITQREVLEQTKVLEPRISALDEELDEESEDEQDRSPSRSPSPRHRRKRSSSRSRSPYRRRRRSRSRSRERHHRRNSRSRSRSASPAPKKRKEAKRRFIKGLKQVATEQTEQAAVTASGETDWDSIRAKLGLKPLEK
eukprot:TRINITY_DN45637_c0_g1_i1.p1 TRINITY_DN45637_c0_g1~~TRINITY_DN45637_c0_g1_i1.p1  ORF type:complete len:300 (+),score=91.18 TRINITY_DN45637_c0_g1_i1:86-985(+)